VIVLAFDAPYYLDTTEINKLNAYYDVYSHVPPCVKIAARALFGEFAPPGASPVDVPGINYDLRVQTSPDPSQAITVFIGDPTGETTPTPEPPLLHVGDAIKLRTTPIMDRNRHRVPDGTPIQFILSYPQEGLESTVTVFTDKGVAETTATIERTGQLDVYVQSEAIPRTLALQITIQSDGGAATIVPITPTPSPTQRPPTPTRTLVPEPSPQVSASPTPSPQAPLEPPEPPYDAGVIDLLLALIGAASVGGGVYYVSRLNNRPTGDALRSTLWCLIGGLSLYIGVATGLPGLTWLSNRIGLAMAIVAGILGATVTVAIAELQRLWSNRQRHST
jgi:beta-N-acetylhexosaminidase